jgi:hypothetical protein
MTARIIGTIRVVVAAAGPVGPVVARPRHAVDRSVTPICAWRLLLRSQFRRNG